MGVYNTFLTHVYSIHYATYIMLKADWSFVAYFCPDMEEEQRRAELKEQAQKEVEQWYTQYAQQVENTKKNNRYY